MMRRAALLARDTRGAAAAEMALLIPLMIALAFGSVELGYYFYSEHALVKEVRNGARYASRLPLVASYSCPSTVTADATTKIVSVTKSGQVGMTDDTPRVIPFAVLDEPCTEGETSVAVTIRCVDKDTYPGLWRGYDGDIPVVKVSGAVGYNSLFGELGLPTASLCLKADSELPVVGL